MTLVSCWLVSWAIAQSSSQTTLEAPPVRKYGVHLGLNATLAFDAKIGRWFYAEAATQLTGIGAIAAPRQGFVVSLFLLGGVSLPLIEREDLTLSFDGGLAGTFLHSYPVNVLSGGLAAGLRLVHRSGFTFAFKLPLIGYAGSANQPRGGILSYYIAAIATMPIISFGYSF